MADVRRRGGVSASVDLRAGARAAAILICAGLSGCASVRAPEPAPGPTEYRVYYLGGQSNMEGFGFVSELSDQQRAAPPSVMIFNGRVTEDGQPGGGVGVWAPLGPGHGTGFSTDGASNRLSDRFGPELSFGQTLAERTSPGRFAIIKYARGGTALVHGVSGYGSWDPDYAEGAGLNQYDNALTSIRAALTSRDIDGDGRTDRLTPAGIIWMQGEADAYDNAPAAAAYDRNLARLIGLFRDALQDDGLPIVIGRIADSGATPATRIMAYSPEVQAAQQRFVENDACAALVTVTEEFRFLPDGWHYLSEDYVRLGSAFADAILRLEQTCRPAS